MNLINCKAIRDKYIKNIKTMNTEGGKVVFIQVGDNPASNTYVNNKLKLCKEVGIEAYHHKMFECTSEEDLLTTIEIFNKDKCVSGVMVQLPLPSHINENKVINAIDPAKDLDGFTDVNKGKLMINDESGIVPCTPAGIITMLEEENIDLNGKNVVIVGRSNIVGKPLSQLMINKGATVTVCNSRTDKKVLLNHIANADIFIPAIGQAEYFNEELLNGIDLSKCIAVDVGINRNKDGKLCGDIARDMYSRFKAITPVPCGVGLLTQLYVVLNSIKCYKNIKLKERV
ncbi:MAG: bifunctional 5,10-methylenetetrahydrofolate dehydrogenase/5,10-methenyltetrahydrofolate cyclohydrolase [Clostridium sp.]|uniref:bifunctional 5,10-methylenetetrahydrofolate dehydrogenase/5,10-methenyltetrahydrofolate cyclohydrolase n=1 Tax=Clostridium sp. TaxID=1506 RepID=UPI003F40358D